MDTYKSLKPFETSLGCFLAIALNVGGSALTNCNHSRNFEHEWKNLYFETPFQRNKSIYSKKRVLKNKNWHKDES